MRNRAARLVSSRFCTAVVSSDVLFPRKRCSGEVFELLLDEAVLDSLDGPGLRKIAPINAPDNTTIDIVAIHGLETRSTRTWVFHKKDSSRVHWLSDSDMLPAAVPEARIFTYDWNANYFQDATVQTLLGRADTLLALLAAERAAERGPKMRPIIFVASCFGGLVLAEAINHAAQEGSPYRSILLATVGAVFLATPFRGSDAAKQARWQVVVGYTSRPPRPSWLLEQPWGLAWQAIRTDRLDGRPESRCRCC
ncbi:hypothetical protein GQ53DRAFT_821051 [Thozetella sp. PMI_491]|nr:hypothetical protein GQ53DRAFT_821051 [Thozetella sp. PMI_491]